jgi:prevent-host-death family protein
MTIAGDAMETAPSAPHSAPRIVNVHQAKTNLSLLVDDAHAGETILLAKAGKPWARLMPLAPPPPQRIPGRLRGQAPLLDPNALLEPIAAEDLAIWLDSPLISGAPTS